MDRLHAVASLTTDADVRVVDLDFSYRKRWWDALWKALSEFGPQLGKYKIFYKNDIDWRVDGWTADHKCGSDGYILLRVRRRLWWRQGKMVLRITGVKRGTNNTLKPEAIECLLYESECTELVQDMLADLGRQLGVRHNLTIYRTPERRAWKWLLKYWD